jgi:hypothetical protein
MQLSDRALTIVAALWIVAIDLVGLNAENEGQFGFPGAGILLSPTIQVLPLGLICGIRFERLRRVGRTIWMVTAVIAFALSFLLEDISKAFILTEST